MSNPHGYSNPHAQSSTYRPVPVRVVTFICGGIAAFLLLRLALVLLGANEATPIVELIRGVADFFAWPFLDIFPVEQNLDINAVLNYGIATVAYVLIGVGISTLFRKHR